MSFELNEKCTQWQSHLTVTCMLKVCIRLHLMPLDLLPMYLLIDELTNMSLLYRSTVQQTDHKNTQHFSVDVGVYEHKILRQE